MITASLLAKYDRPVPRYTSYPTVPNWNDQIPVSAWETETANQFRIQNRENGISLYIHLPFCESLCTYCGCNKKITGNHSVEDTYINTIHREWSLYLGLMDAQPVLRELHLGGGTPTFFSPENLRRLLEPILATSIVPDDKCYGFEGHPNNTTYEHLNTLFEMGFRRVSFGVQDNDPTVQKVINRIQPFANVQKVTEMAREIGYTSVNFDLVYGLPKQTVESMERTLQRVLLLKPDRVAFYSYAHTPWTSPAQRLFDEADLPSPALKMQLYRMGKFHFSIHGYQDIGMDHFALPGDDLYKCRWREKNMEQRMQGEGKWESSTLYRNFMGYTTVKTKFLIGLGVSSISDIGTAYAQNNKQLKDYYRSVEQGILPITKGYFLNAEDQVFKSYIMDISCQGETMFRQDDLPILQTYCFPLLHELQADGLISFSDNGLKLTSRGHHFIRIICSAFDLFLQRKNQSGTEFQYSKAI